MYAQGVGKESKTRKCDVHDGGWSETMSVFISYDLLTTLDHFSELNAGAA